MRKSIVAAAGCAALLACASASAGGLAVAAKAGSLGLGAELTKSLTSNINGRIGFNTFTYDTDGTEDDVDYDVEAELSTVSALIDWYPFSGSFHATLGILGNGNQINMAARSNASFTIGDNEYTPAEVGDLTGAVDFESMAPYLGIGWGNAVGQGKNFSVALDLGVMFQGSPNVDLDATGSLADDADFLADLAREEQSLESELEDLQYYPVIALSVGYQF